MLLGFNQNTGETVCVCDGDTPPSSSGVFLTTLSGVDLTQTADTPVLTVPAGKTFILLGYVITPRAVNNVSNPGAAAPFAGSNQLGPDTSTIGLVNGSFQVTQSIIEQISFSDATAGGSWGRAAAGQSVIWSNFIGATATELVADITIIGFYI